VRQDFVKENRRRMTGSQHQLRSMKRKIVLKSLRSLLLHDGDSIVRTLIHTCAAIQALRFVDDGDIIDRNSLLGTDIRASTASNTFVNIDLRYHTDTSSPPYMK